MGWTTATKSPGWKRAEEEAQLYPKEVVPYPKAVFFIIGTEFCERFCFYGMKAVLTIYLSSILLYNAGETKLLFHSFTMLCYFTPLFGAIIADSWLGKFKTIFYISIVYAIGNLILSIGAIDLGLQTQTVLSLTGLALIAVGTGGIKPCVATLGADQFVDGQQVYLERYFLIFYMCINLGSTFSTAVTPLLRGIPCHGQDSCFPLAFGVPCVLMLIALILFLIGSPFYRKNRPGNNVIVKLIGCVSRAVTNKFARSRQTKQHWLDYADDKYDTAFIEDVKSLCRVLVVFIPVPIFWALFDQQGSTWTLQATQMRWNLLGFEVLPEQIQLLAPVFMVILTPAFGYVIYPILRKCNVLTKPLQKMILGGIIAAIAFFVCAFVQMVVEDQASNAMTLINTASCPLAVEYQSDGALHTFKLTKGSKFLQINGPYPSEIDIIPLCQGVERTTYRPDDSPNAAREKIIIRNGPILDVVDIPASGDGAMADVKVFIQGGNPLDLAVINEADQRFTLTEVRDDRFVGLAFLRLKIDVTDGIEHTLIGSNVSCSPLELYAGEAYTYVISEDRKSCWAATTRAASSISLEWQVPQYFLLTVGEVLFAVTGLEFAYSQAPTSMKSVVLSCWQVTVAVGNLLVVVIAEIGLKRQSTEFIVFGVGMLIDMILLTILAYFYKPLGSAANRPVNKEPLFEESIRSCY